MKNPAESDPYTINESLKESGGQLMRASTGVNLEMGYIFLILRVPIFIQIGNQDGVKYYQFKKIQIIAQFGHH